MLDWVADKTGKISALLHDMSPKYGKEGVDVALMTVATGILTLPLASTGVGVVILTKELETGLGLAATYEFAAGMSYVDRLQLNKFLITYQKVRMD